MNDGADDLWEGRVRSLAQNLSYPPTPDIRAGVRARLRQGPSRRLRHRLAAAGLLVALLLAGLWAVPQVRAAVIRVLRIGAIRILEGGAVPAPATPLPLPPLLAGETTLAAAQEQAGFPIRMPTYPPDLGRPAAVYFQEMGGPVVVLVWLDRERPGQVRLALHQLGPGTYGDKVQPPVVQETDVRGRPAAWTEGPYLLELRGGKVDVTRLVAGHVLVWAEGEVTYRLEGNLDLEEAVRIAESLQ